MRKRYLYAGLGAIFATAVVITLTTGCESESVTQADIRISPGYAEVRNRNEAVQLNASGWTKYRWQLSNPEWGYLSSTVGKSVVYRGTHFGSDQVLQKVTVFADGYGSESNKTAMLSSSIHIRHATGRDPAPAASSKSTSGNTSIPTNNVPPK